MYVLMKVLESAPARYDQGIRLLTWGRLNSLYDRMASHIKEGWRVLDIGCGTGALSLRAARRGAKVVGIDVNSDMLEIAHRKAAQVGLEEAIEFQEKGVGELDGFPSGSFDAVISGLCFSELSLQEQDYTLAQVYRLLKPGGLLLIVDEVEPPHPLKRYLFRFLRFPLSLLTLFFARSTTHPLKDFPRRVAEAGFRVKAVEYSSLGSLMAMVAEKEVQECGTP